MYMRGISAFRDSSTGGGTAYQGAPQTYAGSACPAGMIATAPAKRDPHKGYSITCAPPAPVVQPVAQPQAPNINVAPQFTVSPNIQTQVSPQISPGFIQSSGGGTQSTGATQQGSGQTGEGGGTTGGGITAADLQRILLQQELQRAAADAQRAEDQAAQQALYQQAQAAEAAARRRFEEQLLESQQSAAPPTVIQQGAPSFPVPDISTTVATAETTAAPAVKKEWLYGALAVAAVGGVLYFQSRKKRKR